MALTKVRRGGTDTGISDASDATAITIDSSENVGIGTTSPETIIHATTSSAIVRLTSDTNGTSGVDFGDSDDTNIGRLLYDNSDNSMRFTTNAAEGMRINSSGSLLIATTSEVNTGANSGTGVTIKNNGRILVQADDGVDSNAVPLRIGRLNHDAGDTIVLFSTNGDARGSVTESSGTVSFNAFMGSHITQDVPSDTLEGTVLESTGDLIDSTDEDYKGYVQQKRLTKCKVSDTEDSNNVYGVFQTEAKSGLQYASALGSFFVRVHKDETVALGDLLSSNGDGTAKVQSDDIIRSRTIGKVTSLTKKVTHSDGSFLLPCVLYCG